MSLMGSDTLPGTPGNQIAVAVSEVRSGLFTSGWEIGAPDLGNGVMWLMSTTYQADQPANLAFSFFYNFINTGTAVTGATMSCGVDNYGYIVLNGVKYPSTNGNMSLGYEGIEATTNGSFTVTVPTGLNTLELRVVNAGPVGNTTWQNQAISNGGPTAAWLAITTGTTVLVKTTNKWRCTQFDYPAKFIGPVSLGDVAENAGLSRPYSLAALAGKTMYDNSRFSTTLALPVSLNTAISKTLISPSATSNPLIYLPLFTNTNDTGSAASTVTTNGSVTFKTFIGKQCAYFDKDAYLSLNYIPSTRFTIAFWVFLSYNGYYTISSITNPYGVNTNPDIYAVLQFNTGVGGYYIPTALPSNNPWTLNPLIPADTQSEWHFVAVSINQATYQANYFLNGQLRYSGTGTGPLPERTKIIIGSYNSTGVDTFSFRGYIRKYYFFNTILSEASINDLYSQG
jgi:hypothetical protein